MFCHSSLSTNRTNGSHSRLRQGTSDIDTARKPIFDDALRSESAPDYSGLDAGVPGHCPGTLWTPDLGLGS